MFSPTIRKKSIACFYLSYPQSYYKTAVSFLVPWTGSHIGCGGMGWFHTHSLDPTHVQMKLCMLAHRLCGLVPNRHGQEVGDPCYKEKRVHYGPKFMKLIFTLKKICLCPRSFLHYELNFFGTGVENRKCDLSLYKTKNT